MIQLQNLSLRYGSRTVLDGLSLRFEEGGFYAVMGPNGCGKTTLLRLIAGLLPPSEGSVLLEGRPVSHYSARQLARRVSFVRQQVQTDFEFSAFETVLMGRNPWQHHLQNESQEDWDLVSEAMRLTSTWDLRFKKPSQMSGGELQRVMIARALVQQTPVMLLDEPLSNLDINHQFEILGLLREINRTQHKTILLVLHDLNLALSYCPQLLLLHHGEAVWQGPTAEGLTPERIRQVFQVSAQYYDGNLHLKGIPPIE